MYHHIHIVDQYPVQVLITFMVVDDLVAIIFYLLLNMFRNSANLGLAAGFTNDKEIGHRLMDLAKVQGDDIFSFLFLDRVDDGFDDLRVPR